MRKFHWFVLLTLVALSTGCTRVGPGHVGLVINNSGSQRGVGDIPVKTGWVWYIPGKTSIFEYPTFVQNYVWTKDDKEGEAKNEEITVTTKDQMAVAMDLNIAYRLDETKVASFYVMFRSDNIEQFTHGFLRSTARGCLNETAGKYPVEQIMGDNAEFQSRARVCTQERIKPYGVILEQFEIIGAPRPPQQVLASINAKAAAVQLALQKQNEIVQTEAEAQKTIAKAKGDSSAVVTRAKAEAEANRVRSASLTSELIEYTKLQKWDGRLPQVSGSSNPIVDLRK